MGASGEGAVAEVTGETPPEEFTRVTLQTLQEVTMDFYHDRGVELSAADPELERSRTIALPMAATIGFVGDAARGTLAIAPDLVVATASYPNTEQNPDGLGDWVAETANQVFGRLKNRMLAQGVELLCDTPILVSGQARIGGIRRPAHRVQFAGLGGTVRVWMDLQVDDDIVLAPKAAAVPEGSLVMF